MFKKKYRELYKATQTIARADADDGVFHLLSYVLCVIACRQKMLRESRWRNKVRFMYDDTRMKFVFCYRCVPLALYVYSSIGIEFKDRMGGLFLSMLNLFFSGSLFDISILFLYIFDFEVCNAVWQVFILFLDLYWI